MRKSRFTDEQVVAILRETDREPVGSVAKQHGKDTAIAQESYEALTVSPRGMNPVVIRPIVGPMLALAQGFQTALAENGLDNNVIVLRVPGNDEISSSVSREWLSICTSSSRRFLMRS